MKTIGKINIYNATPHNITFLHDDEVIEVASDFVISATVQEETVKASHDGIEYVRTKFVGNAEGEALIMETVSNDESAVIVGSIIAAQAYPGRVVAMVPCDGFERVPPAEKRMRADKFTTFEGGSWSANDREILDSLLNSYSDASWQSAWCQADIEYGNELIEKVKGVLGLQ